MLSMLFPCAHVYEHTTKLNRAFCIQSKELRDETPPPSKRVCPRSIGDSCESTGSASTETAPQDCGVSPWGVPNVCETNGQGNRICFPGCFDNLGSAYDCCDAFDFVAKLGGNGLSP